MILLLWLLFAQTLGAARAASITFDEGPHLAVGYATLRTGDLRLQPVHIHPPLANVLAAAPLLLNPDLPNPRTIPGWDIASLSAVTDATVWQFPHPARLALAGRLPIILLTLLAGALVLRWATDLGGARAGVLALALYTLDPNIIAHGSLVTTDMAVTTFGLLTLFALYRHTRHPRRVWLVVTGLALGLTLASKVSAVLLVLVVGAVLMIKGGRHAWHSVRTWLTVVLIAFVAVWAVYGFELRSLPDLTGAIPLPAATHVEIYRSLQEHYRLGHPAFLAGHNSDQGWWFYFPVAFVVKTPLPTLLLLGLALIIVLWRRRSVDLSLALFPLVYMVTALFSSVDIGYRHLLPALPFIYIFVAYALCTADPPLGESRVIRSALPIAFYGLCIWLAIATLRVHPFPLTYFNALAGGPTGGYRWLADSNLDWGQNLWQLRDWTEREGVERVYYSHFSPARPEVYGVTTDWLPPDPRAVPFAPFDPAPGVYAIGATTLQGVYTPDVNTFALFRSREPDAVLGHALFVYRQPHRPDIDWVAVCFGAPLDDQQIRAGFGQPEARLVYYDCAQSQVYPTGDDGRYLVLPDGEPPEGATPVLQTRHPDGQPALEILRAGQRPVSPPMVRSVPVDGPVTFLGYRVSRASVHPDETIKLWTYWEVQEVAERPLSLMAHLVGPAGPPLAVGDGLGVPVDQWQAGDVIVQQHTLNIPKETASGGYWLQTGAYWLDTMERWRVGEDSDAIILEEVAVER